MNVLSIEVRAQIVSLRQSGLALRPIAKLVGCNKNTVKSLLTGKYYVPPKQNPNPTGACECGCGATTTQLVYDDKVRGLKAGTYCRFIAGHHHNIKRRENPEYGKQSQRQKLRNKTRDKLVKAAIQSNGKCTVEELKRTVAPEFRMEGVSRMLNYGREMARWGLYEQFPNILVRRVEPIRPRYERPDIPNEFETEIPLLVNQRNATCLDAPVFDGDESRHTIFNSGGAAPTPLELLLLKEEQGTAEYRERWRRIEEWEAFLQKKQSAFRNMLPGVERGWKWCRWNERKQESFKRLT